MQILNSKDRAEAKKYLIEMKDNAGTSGDADILNDRNTEDATNYLNEMKNKTGTSSDADNK